MHPAHLSIDVSLELRGEALVLQHVVVLGLGLHVLPADLVQVRDVEPDLHLIETALVAVVLGQVEMFEAGLEVILHLGNDAQP